MSVNKEIIAWRTIVKILDETGYQEMYQDEISIVANELRKAKEKDKEIERLKNIINKATEILLDKMEIFVDDFSNYPKVYDELYKTLRGER